MLPSNQRLSRQEVTFFLKNLDNKVVFNRLGTFKYQPLSPQDKSTSKITVVTGSKQQKKAVLRNQLRRRIYTLFKNNPYEIKIHAVMYVSKQSYELSFQEIKDCLYVLLSKIEKSS
jgi:ribonuclease P protein component